MFLIKPAPQLPHPLFVCLWLFLAPGTRPGSRQDYVTPAVPAGLPAASSHARTRGQSGECQPRVPKHVAAREQDHPLVLLTRRDASNQPKFPLGAAAGEGPSFRDAIGGAIKVGVLGEEAQSPLWQNERIYCSRAGLLACIMKPLKSLSLAMCFCVLGQLYSCGKSKLF